MNRIKFIQGDITKCQVGAIVNAANSSLLGGGGVDGAIHSAAGPELLVECRTLGGCPTGEAKITMAYRLPAKFVIHTVGPIWDANRQAEMELSLANCYHNSLALAVENGVRTIAFPNISTGVFHFPKNLAAEVAIRTVKSFLAQNEYIEEVTFICFDDENYQLYRRILGYDF